MEPSYEKLTVVKLREELKNRNLLSTGKKKELVKRLEESDLIQLQNSPTSNRNQSKTKERGLPVSGTKQELMIRLNLASNNVPLFSPSAKEISPASSPRRTKSEDLPVDLFEEMKNVRKRSKFYSEKESLSSTPELPSNETDEYVNIVRNPIKTLSLFSDAVCEKGSAFFVECKKHKFLMGLLFTVLAFFHQFEKIVLWYGLWFVYGVASSIGLGFGLHTFVLFLGPFIAKVAIAAFHCNSIDFSMVGFSDIHCVKSPGSLIGALDVINKVKYEAFFWGAGTAFGELPPFFIARASAAIGIFDDTFNDMLKLSKSKITNTRDWVKVKMFQMMTSLGFWGVLLGASIPNPVFDFAGIGCGINKVPFWTFFSATFIGKAIVKTFIQTSFVVYLFEKENIDNAISIIKSFHLHLGTLMEAFIDEKRSQFIEEVVVHHDNSKFDFLYKLFISTLIIFFVGSIINQIARIQLKKRK
ncbi:hypothetical protein O9G_001712 [Rozella allomycis CSF55]|uniref:SAP domain-containing protein n=1 Tax=Rozella allomycis (strain CSF55) TaxID=988480 RepID=A0A075ASZ9_ROZAC|nr:hypothetical protein O9G_001712 [Rozella allomycis CSF55]|eukprot:EPZ33300.1 hypothetical protein O9G_001712 [Rozella allomycis CSF55]